MGQVERGGRDIVGRRRVRGLRGLDGKTRRIVLVMEDSPADAA